MVICSLNAAADKWYIATTGSDTHGKGTLADPWHTLKHATDTVTGANFVGDTIMVGAGTFIETEECALGVGVSIYGAGVTSILNIEYVSPSFSSGLNHGSILLASASENTAGYQSISHLKFDGDSVGTNAIMIKNRGRVKVHDCTFIDFLWNGVAFINAPNAVTPPTTRAVGNMLYDCIIDNCTDSAGSWRSFGLIGAIGQDSLIIHDNLLYANKRAQGYNGDIFTSGGQGFCRRIKYYNNKSWKPDYDGQTWNFHLELFNNYGGSEIYNNEFYGGDCIIDIAGMYENTKGADAYSYRIYDNYFTGTPVETYHGKMCIDIEGELNEDIYIYNNHVDGLPVILNTSDNTYAPSNTRRIYIYYNIFENLGWNSSAKYESCINLRNGNAASILEDIYIYNNVIESDGVTHTAAFSINPVGAITNLMIKNNIITGHTNGSYMLIDNDGTIDNFEVMNNITYGNSNSNNILWQTVGDSLNVSITGNIKADPLFRSTSDLHLQSTSPAINAGIDVSAITGGLDFHGASLYGAAYDIGAFEYGVNRMINIGTTIPTINYKIVLIDH